MGADSAGEGQLVLVDVEGDDAGWSARGGSRIADAMQPVGALNGARANLVGMAVFHLLTIGAAAWLSIYKPGGRIPWTTSKRSAS